ncbi:MAG: hypothetical protein LUE63_00555 [Lachnospiraceae bacterium]|nr:hypothetical protein [Lachnospiraceae bacterium]
MKRTTARKLAVLLLAASLVAAELTPVSVSAAEATDTAEETVVETVLETAETEEAAAAVETEEAEETAAAVETEEVEETAATQEETKAAETEADAVDAVKGDVDANTVTAAPTMQYVENNDGTLVFRVKGSLSLQSSEELIIEYSNNSSFTSNDSGTKWKYTSTRDADSSSYILYVYNDYYNPGDTIYVRARVYDESTYQYSAYSAVVKGKAGTPSISSVTKYVTTSTITMAAYSDMTATGYQFQKKVNGKWVTLAKQTDNTYKDSKLSKNTKYTYRVRSYYYNKITKKTIYSSWYKYTARTWTAKLNFQAAAASSTSAKLTWDKVSGAEGYEIYRYSSDTYSYSQTETQGLSDSYYNEIALVKSLSSKKTSYTDKSLTSGYTYSYTIRAYRTVDGEKVYISDSDSVTLQATSISVYTSYYTSSGKYTVKWDKLTGIKGYYVEKYDSSTGTYTKYKTLKSTATSYTFPKVSVGKKYVEYRIRPYDSSKVYGSYYVYVYPQLAMVTGVTAKKSSTTTNGVTTTGIKVSWKAVSGADYYRVYRTTSSNYTYDNTTKTYDYSYDYNSSFYVSDGATSYFDSSAEAGVTYYYYVMAFKNSTSTASSASSLGYSKKASATYTAKTKAAKPTTKNITVASKKSGQVTLTLKKAVSGAKAYAIYRSTKKGSGYVLIGISTVTTKGKVLLTDKAVTKGKTYYYKVSALTVNEAKAYLYSAKSSAMKVTVKK